MKIAVFVSERYISDKNERSCFFEQIKKQLPDEDTVVLISDKGDLDRLEKNDNTLVVLPASGSVQPLIMEAAEWFASIIIFAGYVDGNFDNELSRKMLVLNGAPSCAEVYGMLKRSGKKVYLCKSIDEVAAKSKILNAFCEIKKSRLLLIGETEPWVLSSSRNLQCYNEKLGVTVEKIPLSELLTEFREVNENDVSEFFEFWKSNANGLKEPDMNDLYEGAKLNAALLQLIKKYNADGAAIACFKLIEEINTTACIAASYINSKTPYVVACEGDVDSLVTMLMLKKLTGEPSWMANPNLQRDNSINFVHCSAPVCICDKSMECVLRSHHETGVGVSTEVTLPDKQRITAVRISGDEGKITIHTGVGMVGEKEPSCHTQLKVCFDDYERYIDTVLGCHQVITFTKAENDVKELAKLLELKIL